MARADVAAYHEAQLTELLRRVADATDRHSAGELDAYALDEVLFHYSRAAKELWKFCNLLPVETAARVIHTEPPDDWWERGERRSR